jgi:hypothetical protein
MEVSIVSNLFIIRNLGHISEKNRGPTLRDLLDSLYVDFPRRNGIRFGFRSKNRPGKCIDTEGPTPKGRAAFWG